MGSHTAFAINIRLKSLRQELQPPELNLNLNNSVLAIGTIIIYVNKSNSGGKYSGSFNRD
jgi:hypothetical protein